MSKLVKLSVVILVIASLVAWFQPSTLYNPMAIHNAIAKIPFVTPFFRWFHGSKDSSPKPTGDAASTGPERIFTKEELAQYKGDNGGEIYLAFLGKVYDVSRGRDFYGPGGGYAFFSGVDASRAFVSGNFKPEGLVDNIEGLENQDYIGIRDWADFYVKDYTYVGKLQGLYYDAEGNPTEYYQQVQKWIKAATDYKSEEDVFKEKYPMCNVDYKAEQGTKLWCSNRSGGKERDWVGVPRSLHSAQSNHIRCACVQESDLDDPLLKEYANCSKDSVACYLPK